MTYQFHLEASAEYERHIRYYRKCQPGLQHRFTAAIEEASGEFWSILNGGE